MSPTSTSSMVLRELTGRTRLVVLGATCSVVAAVFFSVVPAISGDLVWGNLTMAGLAGVLATGAVALAMQLPVTARARTQAFMLAAGVVAFTLGDLTWMYYEVYLGVPAPFPSLPDLFYGPAMYLPLMYALWSALLSMRRLRSLWWPLAVSMVASTVVAAVLWSTTLVRVVDSVGDGSTLFVSLAYPFADVYLLLVPTLALIGVLSGLGGVPLARPWWSIANAMLVLAVSDTVYVSLEAHDLYAPGSLVDVGWILAFAMIVVGIARMLDVYTAKDQERSQSSPERPAGP